MAYGPPSARQGQFQAFAARQLCAASAGAAPRVCALLRCGGCLLVEASASHLRLAPSVPVDYHLVTRRARRLLDPSTPFVVDDLDEGSFAGDLLPDWYDDWVVIERGRHGQAIQAALLAVGEEPLRESAHRILVRAHLAQGNQGEAILHYRRYRKALHQELQVEPSALFDELILGIRRSEPAEAVRL